jgi:hypothetical protein
MALLVALALLGSPSRQDFLAPSRLDLRSIPAYVQPKIDWNDPRLHEKYWIVQLEQQFRSWDSIQLLRLRVFLEKLSGRPVRLHLMRQRRPDPW